MKHKGIYIGDIFTKAGGFVAGIIGVLAFLASVFYSLDDSTINESLITLLISYISFLIAVGLIDSKILNNQWYPKEISISSFYTFCLFVPFAIIFAILEISTLIPFPEQYLSIKLWLPKTLCWIVQLIFITFWFYHKIKSFFYTY